MIFVLVPRTERASAERAAEFHARIWALVRLPSLRKTLEDGFHGSLVRGADGAAVSAVADILAATCFSRRNTLCGA